MISADLFDFVHLPYSAIVSDRELVYYCIKMEGLIDLDVMVTKLSVTQLAWHSYLTCSKVNWMLISWRRRNTEKSVVSLLSIDVSRGCLKNVQDKLRTQIC